jgi:hypothetical protein
MDMRTSVSNLILSTDSPHWSVEFPVFALASVLLLLAEVLSIAATGNFIEPVAESLPSTYLAMMHDAR